MGHTDQVKMALEELKINLHYELDPNNCDQFRTAIQFCGMERFRLCLKLVTLQGDYGPRGIKHDGNSRHRTLLALMRICAPHKNPNTKYRTPASAAGVAVNDQIDREMHEAIARDRD